MEQKTGLAVLNGFSPDEILQFLNHSPLFRPNYGEKDCESNPSFVLKMDALCRMSAYPDIAYCLFVAWDPALNYPMEFIRASGCCLSSKVQSRDFPRRQYPRLHQNLSADPFLGTKNEAILAMPIYGIIVL